MNDDDDKTVPVRVKDLQEWARRLAYTGESPVMEGEIRGYIPKPRLVTVDLDRFKALLAEPDEYTRDMGLGMLVEELEAQA